mgnify:CR=1 FL=1
MSKGGKLIVFSAPSGSGKTTIVRHLLKHQSLNLEFSISATSREPRFGEQEVSFTQYGGNKMRRWGRDYAVRRVGGYLIIKYDAGEVRNDASFYGYFFHKVTPIWER